jgi:hypothetical protein
MAVERVVIERLIRAGRVEHLWRLVARMSPYCSGELRKSFHYSDLGRDGDEMCTLAIRYLYARSFRPPEKWYVSERDAFEKWMDAGAPLLFEDELAAYLRDNPLKEE